MSTDPTIDLMADYGDGRGRVPLSDADRAQRVKDEAEVAARAAAPRSATGRQLRYALNKLGVRSAWDEAVAGRATAAKPDDADYWDTLGSSDLAPETNPKLVRIAAAASPPVDLKALYDAALAA